MVGPPAAGSTAELVTGDAAVAAWSASGAMALTGRADGPALGPPETLVTRLLAIGSRLERASAALGDPVTLDVLALLGERAALAGLGRRGDTSCGGGTRLLRAADGWLAVSLARPEDVELVPAWLETGGHATDVWAEVAAGVAPRAAAALVERAGLLGLPVSALPTASGAAPRPHPGLHPPLPVRATPLPGPAPGPRAAGDLLVVDLTSLWAGPLCASLLHLAGAQVVKVESTTRPDGARSGPPELFDRLNSGKRCVALDLSAPEGPRVLRHLLAEADVVVEASRPRALEHLGILAGEVVASGGPQVWLSITGYGRTGAGRDRVAFGDDAAVGGGLVVHDAEGPCFCADAVADPTTGVVAATACLQALQRGGRWLVDVAMAEVAAHLAGPTLPAPGGLVVAPPRARSAPPPARGPGADTDAVLADLGITA